MSYRGAVPSVIVLNLLFYCTSMTLSAAKAIKVWTHQLRSPFFMYSSVRRHSSFLLHIFKARVPSFFFIFFASSSIISTCCLGGHYCISFVPFVVFGPVIYSSNDYFKAVARVRLSLLYIFRHYYYKYAPGTVAWDEIHRLK